MILYLGLDSAISTIQNNLDKEASLKFRRAEGVPGPEDAAAADLMLIGWEVENPVSYVQKVAAIDKHISILVLAVPQQVKQVKQTLQFSPFVGKNTVCVPYAATTNYTQVFALAAGRTRQKRSFSKISFSSQTRLSSLTGASFRLTNLSDALEHAPIGIIILDKAGKITGANKRARTMFMQLSAGQVPLADIFPRHVHQMILDGSGDPFEFDDVAGNYYEVTSSRIEESDVSRILLLINDVTERKEKNSRIEAILESLPQMAWTADSEGKINHYTQGWYNYTSQTNEEVMSEGWRAIVHPEEVDITWARWSEAVKLRKIFQHVLRFRRYDGEYRWHLSRAVPVYTSKKKVSMWVGTSTDIHDQVLLAEELEQKVRERTRLLEEANIELEQFAYVSSHDLQEPLRKIQTFAHLIKDEENRQLSDDATRYLGKILSTATRMSALLKDMLNFTQLHKKEAPVRVNLREVVSAVSEDLEVSVAENKASIEVGKLPVITGWPFQLKQLFHNLLSNALKFRKQEVPPVVTITARKLDSARPRQLHLAANLGYWEIIVKDNGIGFESQYADKIFTIFQRLHGRSAYEGTGIGLAICKKVAVNHGGDIYAISSPGKGAEFHVFLPV